MQYFNASRFTTWWPFPWSHRLLLLLRTLKPISWVLWFSVGILGFFLTLTDSQPFVIMGGSQSKVQKFNGKPASTSSRSTFKSWSLGRRRRNRGKPRRHSRDTLASPIVEDSPPPWVGGHKIFVALEDGGGLFVNRDSQWPSTLYTLYIVSLYLSKECAQFDDKMWHVMITKHLCMFCAMLFEVCWSHRADIYAKMERREQSQVPAQCVCSRWEAPVLLSVSVS